MDPLPGRHASLWIETATPRDYPALSRDEAAEVAVVGGGITGLTAAALLAGRGADVVLIDAGRVGAGVTAFSTAKLSSLHGLTYDRLIRSVGEDRARAYGEANQAGLERVARFVRDLDLDCAFRRKPNYTYTESPSERDRIESEVVAASKLGLPAFYTEETDLPFPVAAAVRFEDQAEFHPYRYLIGLAAAVAGESLRIYEQTRATSMDYGSPCTIATDRGPTITARRVIVATHFPFLDRGFFFARVHPERSYALAVRVRGALPRGMYLSTESPPHSLRSAPHGDGELLIVGGESHKTGQAEGAERYERLAAYARERFDVESFEYRWSTQDNIPLDGLPYVGRLWPLSDRILTATGYRKWGLAMGTAAGQMLSEQALGRPSEWARAFDTRRATPRASARELVKENANVALRFFGDRVAKRARVEDVAPGEGRIVGRGLRQTAVYRDESGRLHAVSARCTHLGCIVNWNSGEGSWDCPCHGSRFAPDGRVLHGPAVEPLEPRSLD